MNNPGAITVGEVWSLFAVALFFTSLRLYARVKVVGIKGLQVEDYLAVAAMVSRMPLGLSALSRFVPRLPMLTDETAGNL